MVTIYLFSVPDIIFFTSVETTYYSFHGYCFFMWRAPRLACCRNNSYKTNTISFLFSCFPCRVNSVHNVRSRSHSPSMVAGRNFTFRFISLISIDSSESEPSLIIIINITKSNNITFHPFF